MTGDLREVDGTYVIRFERHMTHAAKEVWDYLTLPARTGSWLATMEIDPCGEGSVKLRFTLSGGVDVEGIIVGFEVPRLFAHTWNDPDSEVRWELDGDNDGCLVSLTHTVLTRDGIADQMARWHLHIDALAFSLAGEVIEWPRDREKELTAKYARLFG